MRGERSLAGAGRTRTPSGPEPDDTTLFEIGSVTKVVTSLLLADACVRGEVSLETPLQEVLPGVRVPTHRGGDAITLRHLATHTAGLPRLPMPWRDVVRLQVARHPDPYATVGEDVVLAAVERARLRRRPGEGRMRYSNFGAGLLGIALVRAGGAASYDELVRRRVCEPLGLHDTVVQLDDDQRTRAARGHRRRHEVADWTFPGLPGAGALRSTVRDLLTLLEAELRPDDSPLGDAIRLTQRDHGVSGTTLGWMLLGRRGERLLWHNGGTGGFRAFVGLVPGEQTGVVVLTNSAASVDRAALTVLRPTLR